MKAVLMSIQPKWCELIASGKKRVEVRKTRPKIEKAFKCYIYQTKMKWLFTLLRTLGLSKLADALSNGFGKVIGEFVCDEIIVDERGESCDIFYKEGCLTLDELKAYSPNGILYGWHISDLVIYDKPKELSEFWLYNEGLHKRFDNDEDFCCYDGTNEYGEALTDCGDACNNILNCYRCWEEWSGWCKHLKKPPQSWCYVEEL